MIDKTEKEAAAIEQGGQMGGAYLEELGRFDLSQLSKAEWLQLCECIVGGFVDAMRETPR